MPNYNDAQAVADLLSQFDFNIISEGPGDFSTQHRKYTCEFSKPGIESFTTTYQSNPDVHGQPTATDVFAALASDALADEVYDDVFDGGTIDFDDNNMDIEDFASEAQIAIQDAMDVPIYEAIDCNDEIMEDGELHWEYMSIKEGWGYNFPNPCAMSAEAVRTVNEKGYEAAFNEFWRDFMPEDHELAAVQDVTLIPVTLHFNETPDKSENMTPWSPSVSRIRSKLIPSPKSRRSPVLPRRSRRPVTARASSNRTVMTGRRPSVRMSVRMSVPMGTPSIR